MKVFTTSEVVLFQYLSISLDHNFHTKGPQVAAQKWGPNEEYDTGHAVPALTEIGDIGEDQEVLEHSIDEYWIQTPGPASRLDDDCQMQ